MDLFRRKEYSFETPEIRKWLKSWLKDEKWPIRELMQFLQKNYELETPIYFANYNALHSSVDCISANGKSITMQYYQGFPRPQVRITAGDVIKCYNLEIWPYTSLVGKITKKNGGNTLRAKYREHDYTYKMYDNEFYGEYRLRLFITDSVELSDDATHRIITYTDRLEEYLIDCNPTDALSVYKQVCELIDFDYKEIDNIHITYNAKEEIKELTITEIEVEYSRIVSCEAHIGKKIYKVSLNSETWSWEYIDCEHSISFESIQDRINSAEQAREEIESDVREEGRDEINPETLDSILSEITQTISKLLEVMG